MSWRRVSLAALPVLLALPGLAAPAAAQERVPAEPIPFPADSVPAPEAGPPVLPGLPPGVEVVEETSTWAVDLPGFYGLTLARYNRVDGAVPAWGITVEPNDPARRPALSARVGLATTHERPYWDVAARQRLPAPGALAVVLRAFQRGSTFDDWKLSVRENDFATFLVGADLLDWWRERGASVALDGESTEGRWGYGLRLTVAEQASQELRPPFVLFGGDDDFDPNPAVEEGNLHALEATVRLDTRDVQSPLLPAPGWLVTATWEGAGGPLGGDLGFSRLALDARRYVRFARDAWWDSRLVWMGPTSGARLPAQRTARLGGAGSLRGFDARTFVGAEALQAQTELRLPLPVTDPIAVFFLTWHWTAFADAGKVGGDDDWHADVGTGISGINIFSYLGIFVAQRVTDFGRDDGPRLVVRLRRDF